MSERRRKMSFFKIKGTLVALVALAMIVASAHIARAETIFLSCSVGELSANTYTVDLTNNTVDNFQATINETAIDWVREATPLGGSTASTHFHIDRTAGTIAIQGTICFHDQPCQPSHPYSGVCTKV